MVIPLAGNFHHSLVFRQTSMPAPPERVYFMIFNHYLNMRVWLSVEITGIQADGLLKAAGDIR
jgi:hypothetical protein